jgi:hypothetical protein
MFDALTDLELSELTERLCNAIYDVKHNLPVWHGSGFLSELLATEHDVWHTHCVMTGRRCLQCMHVFVEGAA